MGLTAIHVNRTLRLLRDQRLIAMDGKQVTILDFAALSRVCDFDPSYLGDNARALLDTRANPRNNEAAPGSNRKSLNERPSASGAK